MIRLKYDLEVFDLAQKLSTGPSQRCTERNIIFIILGTPSRSGRGGEWDGMIFAILQQFRFFAEMDQFQRLIFQHSLVRYEMNFLTIERKFKILRKDR